MFDFFLGAKHTGKTFLRICGEQSPECSSQQELGWAGQRTEHSPCMAPSPCQPLHVHGGLYSPGIP